jgi:hypothetical protein
MTLVFYQKLAPKFPVISFVTVFGAESGLNKTELQNAQVGTIRTKLLKLGALITVSTRRILIAITSFCPYKHIFAAASKRLKMLPNTT